MCMHPDSHKQLPNNCLCPLKFCLFFVSLDMFFRVFYTVAISLYGEYVKGFPLPDGVFLSCGHGLDWLYQLT